MTTDYTHIAFTDLETTGLYPEHDHLLEVGIVLTDTELNVIAENSWLVIPPKLDLMRMHPKVREMHTANGLLDAILEAAEVRLGAYGDAQYVDFEILGWLQSHVPNTEGVDRKPLALGGSGVSHFDIRWINKYLPALGGRVHRSTVDVGVIRRFIENVAGVPGLVPAQHRDLSHRALDDARDHLAEARIYRAYFRDALAMFPATRTQVATGLLPTL